MSYKDLFGDVIAQPVSVSEDTVTPVDDMRASSTQDLTDFVTATGAGDDDLSGLLVFDRFTSGLPLLMERPSKYVQRLLNAAGSMIQVGEDDQNGGLANRILWSPSIAFPFFLLFGDEQFKDEDVLKYPFLHVPSNHQPTVDTKFDEYALTLYALYTATGLMGETHDGAIATYGLVDPFEVSDQESWDAAVDWAQTVTPLLADLNKARLLGFTLNDLEHEADALNTLFDLWNESRSQTAVIEAGKQAASMLEIEYNIFLDAQFKPFRER